MNNASKILVRGYFKKKSKEWKTIALVVFLCVVFFSSITSCCIDAVKGINQYTQLMYGKHQFHVFNFLNSTEVYANAEVGIMELQGYLDNEVSLYQDKIILGTVDKNAIEIGCLSLMDGEMPQKKGEIAVEESVLKRMNIEETVGDEISLCVYWAENGQYRTQGSKEKFIITGIIKDYSRIWMAESEDPYYGFPGIWLSDSERSEFVARVDLMYFEDVKDTSKLEGYYQDLTDHYKDAVIGYNVNNYITNEKDSIENQKSIYIYIAAIIMAIAIIAIMAIGIISILSLGVVERKKQQTILYQIGVNKRESFVVLCKQVYAAALIGIIPGIFCSCGISLGIKKILFNFLNIYTINDDSCRLIFISIIPIIIAIGISCAFSYKLFDASAVKNQKNFKESDFVRRICNGSFGMQRKLSVLLLIASLLVILPVQMVIDHYKNYFAHDLEKDVNIRLESNIVSGSLAVSEGRKGITLKDYKRLQEIEGIENISYAMQIESAKILLSNPDKKIAYDLYSSNSETVPQIENMDIGNGIDYITRDKIYYGYSKESALIPCTIQGVDWKIVSKLSENVVDGFLNKNDYITGKKVYAVVWEEEYEKTQYPIKVGDSITITNLVQTELSPNYWEKPDEAKRVDTTTIVGGIIKVPLELKEELGCTFVYGSYTFLRSLEALEQDGHDISFQNIFFDYSSDSNMRAIDEKIKNIISHYNFVSFDSKYEKIEAENQFKLIVFIFAGSIWVLGSVLSGLLLYRKIISSIILKKRQLYVMWCMGMHKEKLSNAVKEEIKLCVIYSTAVALLVTIITAYWNRGIKLGFSSMFIIINGILIVAVISNFTNRWIRKMDFYDTTRS